MEEGSGAIGSLFAGRLADRIESQAVAFTEMELTAVGLFLLAQHPNPLVWFTVSDAGSFRDVLLCT